MLKELSRNKDFYEKARLKRRKKAFNRSIRIIRSKFKEGFHYQYPNFKAYRDHVDILTECQDLSMIDPNKTRAFRGYHVDHIISVQYGYKNRIPAQIIAHITNLQMLHWEENMSKGSDNYCNISSCTHLRQIND